MVEWTPESSERMFELYEQYFDRMQQNVAAANRSLGSSDPNRTRLEKLTRSQFVAMCTDPTSDKETIKRWIRRIIRGHENEFPTQQLAG